MLSPIPVDEKELLSRLSSGDETALLSIYKQHWKRLFVSAFNVLKDRSACEDIVQEIFVHLWIRRESLDIKTSLSAYLYAATRYQVFRAIRTKPVAEHLFENLEARFTTPSPEDGLHLKELNRRITQIVDTLPDQCRLIFKMSREEQLSHKEIAERLNISPKTVENQIAIALKKLRFSLGDTALVVAISMLVSP